MPWGKASSELVSAVYDQNVVAIIALDRNSSHLAEQIGVKSLVPVIAVSSDHALTSTNIPWIFRLPEGTSLEQALQTRYGGRASRWAESLQDSRRACLGRAIRGRAVSDHWRTSLDESFRAPARQGSFRHFSKKSRAFSRSPSSTICSLSG